MEGRRGGVLAHPALQPDPAAALSPRGSRARAWPPLLAGAVVAAVIGWQIAPALVGVFYDDGLYLGLARSLAEGHGYRHLHLPGTPHAVHYPFGYPAFLALLWWVWPAFPANVALFKGANAVLVGAFAAVTARHLGERLEAPRAVPVIVAAGALAVPLVAVATVLFAEPLFLALAAPALWAADSARRATGWRALRLASAAGTLAGLAMLTRSIGLAVAVGVTVSLLRRPRIAAAAAAPALLLLAPWLWWANAWQHEIDPATVANYGTYGQFVAQAGSSWVAAGVTDVLRPVATVLLPPLPRALWLAAAVPVVGLVVWGGVVLGRSVPALGWMLAAYFVIVARWPYGPDRFVWAALPWLGCALFAGTRDLVRRARAPAQAAPRAGWLRAAALATAVLVVAGFGYGQARGYARGAATLTQRGISETMEAILPWVRERTDSASVIATEDEALVWLYTGRRAVPSYLWRVRGRGSVSLGPDTLRAYLERTGATHLVLTGPRADAAPDVDALLGRYPGLLDLVYTWPGQVLAFRIRRGGRGGAGEAGRERRGGRGGA